MCPSRLSSDHVPAELSPRTRTIIIVTSVVGGVLLIVLIIALLLWTRRLRQPIRPPRTVTGYEYSTDSHTHRDVEKGRTSDAPSSPTRTFRAPYERRDSEAPSSVAASYLRQAVGGDRERDRDPRYEGRMTKAYNELVDVLAKTPAPPPPSLPGIKAPTGNGASRASIYRNYSFKSKRSVTRSNSRTTTAASTLTVPRTVTDYETEGSHYHEPPASLEAHCGNPLDLPRSVSEDGASVVEDSPYRSTPPLRFARKSLVVVNV